MANTRKVVITLDHLQIPSDTTGDVPIVLTRANFPDEMFDPIGANQARSDGGDLELYSDAALTDRLDLEIVSFGYDSVLGAADANVVVWVNGAAWALSSLTDPTPWATYGDPLGSQPAVGDLFGRNAVWTTYERRKHLGGSGTDSTGSGDATLVNSPATTTGKVGSALQFNGTNQRLSEAAPTLGSEYSVEMWAKIITDVGGTTSFYTYRSTSASTPILFQIDHSARKPRVIVRDDAGNAANAASTTALFTGVFYKIDAVRNGGTVSLYVNAGFDVSASATFGPISSDNLATSAYYNFGTTSYAGFLTGAMDETGVLNGAKSADRITLEYNNQLNPAGFATPGTPTDIAAAGETLVVDAGSYTLTGTAAGLRADYNTPVVAGGYALTGSDVTLRAQYRNTAATGSYALTGSDVVITAALSIVVDPGTYALTGTLVNFIEPVVGYTLVTDSGEYLLTGSDVILVDPPMNYTLAVDAGAYSLTGTAAGLRADLHTVAEPGVFTLTGSDVVLTAAYSVTIASGEYTLTGTAVGFIESGAVTQTIGVVYCEYVSDGINLAYVSDGINLAYVSDGINVNYVPAPTVEYNQ